MHDAVAVALNQRASAGGQPNWFALPLGDEWQAGSPR
jgi:hypothetical protein